MGSDAKVGEVDLVVGNDGGSSEVVGNDAGLSEVVGNEGGPSETVDPLRSDLNIFILDLSHLSLSFLAKGGMIFVQFDLFTAPFLFGSYNL